MRSSQASFAAAVRALTRPKTGDVRKRVVRDAPKRMSALTPRSGHRYGRDNSAVTEVNSSRVTHFRSPKGRHPNLSTISTGAVGPKTGGRLSGFVAWEIFRLVTARSEWARGADHPDASRYHHFQHLGDLRVVIAFDETRLLVKRLRILRLLDQMALHELLRANLRGPLNFRVGRHIQVAFQRCSAPIDVRRLPACAQHNLRKSKDDEYLMMVLSCSHLNNEISQRQFDSKVMRAWMRRPHLAAMALRGLQPASLDGEETGQFRLDMPRFKSSMNLISAGLIFHGTQERWLYPFKVWGTTLLPSSDDTAEKVARTNQIVAEAMPRFFEGKPLLGENPAVFQYQTYVGEDRTTAAVRMLYYEGIEVFTWSGRDFG